MRGTLPEVTLPIRINRALTRFAERPAAQRVRASLENVFTNPNGPLTVSAANLSAAQGGLRIERRDAAQRAEQPLQMEKKKDLLATEATLFQPQIEDDMAQVAKARRHATQTRILQPQKTKSNFVSALKWSAATILPAAVVGAAALLNAEWSVAYGLIGAALFNQTMPVFYALLVGLNATVGLIAGGLSYLGISRIINFIQDRAPQAISSDDILDMQNLSAFARKHPEIYGDKGLYKLSGKVGKGNQGAVIAATDKKGRQVAVKILDPEANESAKKRFDREIRVLEQIKNPHIVEILDHGKANGNSFLVMEMVAGDTIKALIKSNQSNKNLMHPARALLIAVQIVDGLSAAYRHNILHRDIKPANILVTPEDIAVIVDWGLAKARDSEKLTQTDVVAGTPAYMDPLLLKDDCRSDMYSLGVVLYEALTGKKPFEFDSFLDFIRSPQNYPLRQGTVPDKLFPLLERLLTRELEQRFSSYDELSRALDQITSDIDTTNYSALKEQAADFVREQTRELSNPTIELSNPTIELSFSNMTIMLDTPKRPQQDRTIEISLSTEERLRMILDGHAALFDRILDQSVTKGLIRKK